MAHYKVDPLDPTVFESSSVAVCPTCKTIINSPWQLFGSESQLSVYVTCEDCGEGFAVTKKINVSYRSTP